MSNAKELGERKIIELIINKLEKIPDMPIPFGDDITGIRLENGKIAILKTDMLIAATDVPPGMTPFQAARKAVVMNISDLASKGVEPNAVLVALGLPAETSKEDIEEIGRGLNAGAREYGAYVIGGDTSEASDIILSVMLFGICDERYLVKRSGSRPGDILAVTGLFGRTSAGLKMLLEGFHAPEHLKKVFLKAVYMPEARLELGLKLAKSNSVTSTIDSSDGLAVSLHELRKVSNTGFCVTSLPTAPEVEEYAKLHSLSKKELTLFGGEEYELVVTINPEKWDTAVSVAKSVNCQLIPIGHVTEEKEIVFVDEGRKEPIPPGGWEHFKS